MVGGGEGVEEVPCIAFSIQLVICAALNASEFGSWLEGNSWWQTGHSSSSAMRGGRGIRGSGRSWCSVRGTKERILAGPPDTLADRPGTVGRVGCVSFSMITKNNAS